MSTVGSLLVDSAERLFRELPLEPWVDHDHWQRVVELGLGHLLIPEEAGGAGGDWTDAYALTRSVGARAVALAIVEDMAARWLVHRTGLTLSSGACTFAICADAKLQRRPGQGYSRFHGRLPAVPWGRSAESVITAVTDPGDEHLVLLSCSAASERRLDVNVAGEPRDELIFEDVGVQSAPIDDGLLLDLAALMRTAQISGALDSVLDLCIVHATSREQFGKAIGNFQAVQHQIAELACAAAAVSCASRAAFRSFARGDAKRDRFAIAAARLRANLAIPLGTSVAHQVHGAIGFTQEHALHRYTQRLWSWRSEFGNDRAWANRLARHVCAGRPDSFWIDMTERDDQVQVVE
jgi:acyl-CoA dehydrogenase